MRYDAMQLDAHGNPLPIAEPSYDRSPPVKSGGQALPPFESVIVERRNLPPQQPILIEGLLRKNHKMMIAAKSKAGKTWLLIELCVALATGGEWLGKQCAEGRVLYMNFELDSSSFMHRFFTVIDALDADKHKCKANIDVWNLRGYSMPLEELNRAIAERVKGKELSAVILDPMYKVQAGDENTAKDIGAFCRGLDELSAMLDASVIYCHHHSKGAQGGKDVMDRASGSGVFARDADALLDLTELALDSAAHEACDILHREDVSAWRMEAVLREFKFMEPINLWFKYPLHFIDDTETLAGCSVKGFGSGGASFKKNVSGVDEACERLMGEGESFPASELESELGIAKNTLRKRLDASSKFDYLPGENRHKPALVARAQ